MECRGERLGLRKSLILVWCLGLRSMAFLLRLGFLGPGIPPLLMLIMLQAFDDDGDDDENGK